jgi:ribosomal protein S4E
MPLIVFIRNRLKYALNGRYGHLLFLLPQF